MTYFRQEKEEEEKESEEKGSDEDDDESGEKKDVTSGPWGKVEAPAPAPAPHKPPEPEPGQSVKDSFVLGTGYSFSRLAMAQGNGIGRSVFQTGKTGQICQNISTGKFRVFKFKDVRGLWWYTVIGFEANFELGNNQIVE